MRPVLTPTRTADDQFEIAVETPAMAQALARTLRSNGLTEDVVAGLSSVCIRFHPRHAAEIEACLGQDLQISPEPVERGEPLSIAIRYGGDDGPDLEQVCTALSLSVDAFIAMHTGREHMVEMIGFTPGFSYISGLPHGMKIPRLNQPRPRVAAGSVGISADFTGLYALAGPGGWPLIGRTEASLFDASSDDPFRLKPGQRVQFRAI